MGKQACFKRLCQPISGDPNAVIIVIRQYCDFIHISAVPVEVGAACDRGIAPICRQSGQIFAEASTKLAPAVTGN
jgi:hypothetical protein